MGAQESVTTGQIRWFGYLLDCRECGATDRWTLSIEQATEHDGEVSWLACQNGHRVRHPLIYPEIVHRVIGWATSPNPDQYGGPASQKLRGWLPHWTTPDATVYREWTEPGPIEWAREWPELVEAYKILDKIKEWSASTPHTDISFIWMSAWGTTDPDVRHIEILESSYCYANFHTV